MTPDLCPPFVSYIPPRPFVDVNANGSRLLLSWPGRRATLALPANIEGMKQLVAILAASGTAAPGTAAHPLQDTVDRAPNGVTGETLAAYFAAGGTITRAERKAKTYTPASRLFPTADQL